MSDPKAIRSEPSNVVRKDNPTTLAMLAKVVQEVQKKYRLVPVEAFFNLSNVHRIARFSNDGGKTITHLVEYHIATNFVRVFTLTGSIDLAPAGINPK